MLAFSLFFLKLFTNLKSTKSNGMNGTEVIRAADDS
jgi:hypothetical protein